MKLISYFCDLNLVALCLISVTAAAPPPYMASPPPPPPNKINYPRLLKYENKNLGFGNYKYAYEQFDGTRVEQVGQIKNQGTKDEILAVSGLFQWISPEGIAYTVRYTADEEGYRPKIEQETSRLDSFRSETLPNYVASLIG